MSAFLPLMSPVRRDVIFGVLAALALGLFVARASARDVVGFPLDDAWIHQTYARNLAQHGEWAFIAGQPSAASTSPLYTVLLSLGHRLGLAPFVWTHFLGLLALTGGAMMAARLGERLFPDVVGVGWAAGLAVLGTWQMVWAAAAGMETMLFMALSLATLTLALRETDIALSADLRAAGWRGLQLGAVGGLLTLARPEGIGLVGLVGVVGLLTFGSSGRWLGWGLGIACGWLLLTSPALLLNYSLTGTLLPDTASAKVAEYAIMREAPLATRYARLLLPLFIGSQALILPGLVVGIGDHLRIGRKRWFLCLPLLWAVAHVTLYVLRLPVSYQHGRYVMPALPPLLVVGAGGLLLLVRWGRRTAIQRVLTRTLALSAALAFPAFLWIGSNAYANDVRLINTEMVATAKWLADNIPADELLAVHDIGAVGYYAPREILDLAGLVSPEVVPIIRDHAALMALICERDARWLMVLPDQRPAPADDPRLQIAYESPYNFAAAAYGSNASEVWKMRVYAVQCEG